MDKFIKESYIYKIIVSIWNFICNLFSNSFLVNMFLKEKSTEEIQKETIFSKLINRVINGIRKIFAKLKLDKLLNNSIFTKPIIWVSLVTGLTPFLPTMAVLLLVLLSMGSLFLKIILDKEFKFKRSNVNVWILLFILVYMFSAFTSLSTAEYKNIFMLTVSFILFYFVVINTVDTKKKLNVLLYIFISSATIASLYGLYQYAYGDLYSQAWLDKNMFEDIKMRVYSTFENPNVFGEYLILVIPIIVGLFFREKGIKKKVLLLGMLGINTLALVFTFSRGCWLGILFALAILAVVIDRRFILLGVLLLMLAPFVLP